ncbi:MAG TPA: amino acid adenylation domain-containing protein, partial [Ktedonobacteraceae bacterium]
MRDSEDLLDDEKEQLLALLLAEEGLDTFEEHDIPVREQEGDVVLSFTQQQQWVLDQLAPGNPAYVMPLVVSLRGRLRLAALQRSLAEIVRRHEALRTTFLFVEGTPVQRIHQALPVQILLVDLADLPPQLREIHLQQLARDEGLVPFDLEHGPLLRVHLLRLGENEHILLLSMHHIISDRWSLGILLHELSILYTCFSTGQPSPLPPLPLQYADYTLWQRERMQGEEWQAQLAYWTQQLRGAPEALDLSASRARPAILTSHGARFFFTLPPSLVADLHTLSRQTDATLFMLLLAGWQILLGRYSGQDDLLVGTPIANRTNQQLEQLIGYFANTLVLRADLSGNPRFHTFLARVRQVCLEAYAHQDIPFEQVVSALHPQRNLSHTPLFQVMFVLQNVPMQDAELPGLLVQPLYIERPTTRFELTLTLNETEQGLLGMLEYNTDLFEASTIVQMAHHYQTLLEAIVADPHQRLAGLSLLTETEQEQILSLCHRDLALSPADTLCLHELFEAQVERTPDAIALSLLQEHISYQELNRRANHLARRLQSHGVGPDVWVGLGIERSMEMVVGLLAILKAGGAYVPLDPAFPSERLAFLLSDARVSLVLTRPDAVEQWAHLPVQVLVLQPGDEDPTGENGSNPVSGVTPQNLAYVIYTSGSTGQPKGIMIPHSNVHQLFTSTQTLCHFTAGDVWTLFHSIAFDFSVWEVWGALLAGGRLVLVPYWLSRSPQAFWGLLQEQQVTVLNQTPSAFRALLAAEDAAYPHTVASLRLIIFGGEALDFASLAVWWQRHGEQGTRLINMYGITETTVHVTAHLLEAPDQRLKRQSLIGRPRATMQLYVLDASLQPVPPGIAGELYIGGTGLARGYLANAALTAERFVPHPWSTRPGDRLYRTGDVARLLDDGEVEYLGRNDAQVKLRGFRIEPGEIEAVLATHPNVQNVAVRLLDQRLVAYLVPHGQQKPGVSELRAHLQARLPDYMVPSAFLLLDELPLTPHGKLDLRALPLPGTARPDLHEPYAPPRTPVEEILAGIWSQVLKLERVGIDDNFFTLGGDSIRSIQVLALARERGLQGSMQQLFQHQTIAGLAHTLTQEEATPFAPRPSAQLFSLLTDQERQSLPEGVEDAYPVSLLQAGMFFHSDYSPASAIYHDIFSLRLQARLDIQAWRETLRQVTARHQVLRTSFDMTTFSRPLQMVQHRCEIPLQVEDWSSLSSSEQDERFTTWREAEKGRHFDWSQAPLMRVAIYQRSKKTFDLVLSFHHAILDGWSVASLFSELFQRYLSLLDAGDTASSPPPAALYRDFVALELQALESAAAKQYWQEKLRESSRTVLARWPQKSQEHLAVLPHTRRVALSQQISEELTRLARAANVPLKSVLLAAHVRVMGLLSGERDVLTGLVANGRPEIPDGELVLGLFLNTVPHRQKLSGGTWLDLVRETFEAERDGLAFRRYPLAQIQQDGGGQPLFETAFNFVHFHIYEGIQELKSLQVVGSDSFEQTNFTLLANFNQSPHAPVIHLRLEANASMLPEEQVDAIVGYYLAALTAMVHAPTSAYERLHLLSASEEQRLLVEWNNTRADFPRDRCLPQLIEEQAARTPDAIALVSGEGYLSYQELNQRANQLARHLRALGIGAESLVGVYMERCADMLVSLLGILKAGGGYVPLDPASPWERIAFMQRDTAMRVLLTQAHLVAGRELPGIHILCLEHMWEEIAQRQRENLSSGAEAENLAYVIYTSGSTGKPKGVQIVHRTLLAFLTAMRVSPGIRPQDRWLALTPLTFDIATLELFLPLLVGATVILAPRETLADGAALAHQLRETGATVAQATPATWRLFVQATGTRPDVPLTILCGGEAFPRDLLAPLLERATAVWNLYGPTETTIWSSIQAMQASSDPAGIGRPIANTRLYLLNSYLLPVPVGVAGELYIGGQGVARGYLQRPDLTAERFIPDPFSQKPGARLYRTGDWARYQPDGALLFSGRQDQQVKIRGHRIELGEIEAALLEQAGVREAAVAIYEQTPEDQRLVAYVVAAEPEKLTLTELRQALAARLPDFMLPSTFQWLSALPLTPHGKLDRRALPAPDRSRPEQKTVFVAARTPLEELLAGIWCQVLQLERVGTFDNFFTLGGHSLLATQVIARVREMAQVEVPLRTLFETPTVAGLAASITRISRQAQGDALPPLLPALRQGDVSLSFAQQRLWFLDQFEPDHALYNLSAAVSLQGVLHLEALEQSLNEIVRRHEALRTTFPALMGHPIQRVSPALQMRIPVVDLTALAELPRQTQARALAREEARLPFDLAQGPLLRARVLRLSAREQVLLLSMHHIVSDGWSLGVFARELTALYASFSTGQPSPLPALPLQYADYALWQRQWLQGEVVQAQMAYWKHRLQQLPVLDLPADRARPSLQTFRGATHAFTLPGALSADLQAAGRREGVTLFMSLLAGWMICLARYSGQDDLAVGTPIANRRQRETESLIGCFINTLVLRADLSGNPSFRAVLRQVREVTLQAYAHQDIPFEQLVEAVAPQRDLSRSPLFQVLFVLQNTPREAFELAGLTPRELDRESGTARFELTLTLTETGHGLRGMLEYNSDLFEAQTIARIANSYQRVLEALVADPQRRLSQLPMLSREEQQQVLSDWNATHTDIAWERWMPHLFAQQVARSPEAIALVCEEEQLTYRELDRRANRLAHYLRQRGIGPEALVGIFLPRSRDLVITLLAIFKAGGAFLPLDPAYPRERLALLMADAQSALVVTREDLLAALPSTISAVVCLERDQDKISAAPATPPSLAGSAASLAYVIYTSGSTGTPKGVMVAHAQLTNFFYGMDRLIGSEGTGTWLATTSISFDIAGLELFWTLIRGYRVVIRADAMVSPAIEHSINRFIKEPQETPGACIQREQVTHFQCTPSLMRTLLLETDVRATFARLRTVLLGGEALPFSLASQCRELLNGDLLNMYGPTETTIWSTSQRVMREQSRITLGRPLVNTRLYLLDRHWQPVPVGAVGEIFIGGAGVARGYLHRPDLTAERFIPDPFGSEPGARLYRTGDRARYLPDGEIEYVGRVDYQVKIRGVRVELGEIEAVLSRHPAVSECAVVVREAEPGDPRLVAYVVAHQPQNSLVSDLRSYLGTQLPTAMLPAIFMVLPALPLMPNGKLDRRALTAPAALRPHLETRYQPPRTPLEELVAALWSEVLRVEQIGVHDDFFALGGHSLLATQVIARARSLFQLELPLRSL